MYIMFVTTFLISKKDQLFIKLIEKNKTQKKNKKTSNKKNKKKNYITKTSEQITLYVPTHLHIYHLVVSSFLC